MDIEFNSVNELYKRIEPALRTKKGEMERIGFSYIKEEDIWNYLKEIKWKQSINLSLAEMVDDILNTDELIIDSYLKEKLKKTNRKTYLED